MLFITINLHAHKYRLLSVNVNREGSKRTDLLNSKRKKERLTVINVFLTSICLNFFLSVSGVIYQA